MGSAQVDRQTRADQAVNLFKTFVYSSDGTRRSWARSFGPDPAVTSFESWEDSLGGDATQLTQGLDAYIWGPDGMALERVESDGSPNYLWQDSIGSVIGTTNSSGTIKGIYNYDAWGRRTGAPTAFAGVLGFAGEVTDPETDIQYLRARYYDPKTAQFLTRDPLEKSTGQPYLYAAGNPTMFGDPSGEGIIDFEKNAVGGLLHGATGYKPGWADSCSWAYFWSSQVGGQIDPRRKARAADDLIDLTKKTTDDVFKSTSGAAKRGSKAGDDLRDGASSHVLLRRPSSCKRNSSMQVISE